MTEAVATYEGHAGMLETVLVKGDLSQLTAQQRLDYINEMCKVVGINPMSRPFQYITLSGRLTLYATRDCTDQIRKRDRISVTITARERMDDVYVVTARATLPDGRTDEAIGAVNIKGLTGEALANAMMKAETKAKRRVTLSIGGLGMLDETEVEDIPTAQPAVTVERPKALPQGHTTTPAKVQPPAQKPPLPELVKKWNEYLAICQKAKAVGVTDYPDLAELRAREAPFSEYDAVIADIQAQIDAAKA